MAKTPFKILIIIAILIITLILGGIIYLKLFGKNLVEMALSNAIGQEVSFKSIAVNLREYKATFTDITVQGERPFRKTPLFKADVLHVSFDKEQFDRNRRIVFDLISIEGATLHIERNRGGVFNIAGLKAAGTDSRGGNSGGGVAYAITPKPTRLYTFARNVKKLVIADSVVEFADSHIFGVPYLISCNNLNVTIVSKGSADTNAPQSIPISCDANLSIPSNKFMDGEVRLKANIMAYEFMQDADIAIETEYVDITNFTPYLEEYTPFHIIDGIFSSATEAQIVNNQINSLTTMEFHTLRLYVDPEKQSAQFLNTAVPKLLPYLTSRSGGLIFDFIVTGPITKPRASVGPQVQEAIGLAATEEILKTLRRFQK